MDIECCFKAIICSQRYGVTKYFCYCGHLYVVQISLRLFSDLKEKCAKNNTQITQTTVIYCPCQDKTTSRIRRIIKMRFFTRAKIELQCHSFYTLFLKFRQKYVRRFNGIFSLLMGRYHYNKKISHTYKAFFMKNTL